MYYNPFNEGNEFFVKRKDIPGLEPMWGDDKGEARHKVYDFLNSQNLRLVKEIEPNENQELIKNLNQQATTLVTEINENNPSIRELQKKHMREGIMRRNGLLLEHIMHERIQNNSQTRNYFTTPDNIHELRN